MHGEVLQPDTYRQVTTDMAAVCKIVGYPADFRFSIVMRGDVCQKDRVCLPNAAPSRINQA
jgi:hypothetical protein